MLNIEIAEAVKNVNLYEMAEKALIAPAQYTDDEKVVAAQLDTYFKQIGERGEDPNREIAAFITRVVEDEIFNAPDDILDLMFTRGTIGEFDDYQAAMTPKNTFVAYEAAKGGNVERSWLDYTVMQPTTKHLQIETDISYADLRKNGWKTIALITTYATAALKNQMFKIIFSAIDAGVTSGAENYISESSTKPTQTSMDALALYLMDRGGGTIIGLSKYVQAISKLTGFDSESMRDEVHRRGVLGMYDGNTLISVSAADKLADGSTVLPDKSVFGIAGKIGTLDMKGSVRIYQTPDNNDEKYHIKITGFEFAYAFNKDTLENIAKVHMEG